MHKNATDERSDSSPQARGAVRRIVFGPLGSRRLGRSLGINNIPPKHCSYSCIYCQVGTTPRRSIERESFFSVAEVVDAAGARLADCRSRGETIDTMTFVPSGEPTLDVNLGAEIRGVKSFGYPVAVSTNGSLLTRPDVREDLMAADVVSIKVDTVKGNTWRRINRPAAGLDFEAIREGMREFSRQFRGRLLTDTMVVAGVNDDAASIHGVGRSLAKLIPFRAYLTTPTRPPAIRVESASDQVMARLFLLLAGHVPSAGLLLPHCSPMLAFSGDPGTDLVSAVAVHPLTEESVAQYLASSQVDWTVVENLIATGRLERREHQSRIFLVPSSHVAGESKPRRRSRRGK